MKRFLVGVPVFLVCIVGLTRLDRFFFKHNSSFCLRFIHSTLPFNPDWEIPSSKEEQEIASKVLDQKFHYFDKGGQTFAFISEDGNFVIKFCKFPSSLRPLPWLNHVFSKIKSLGSFETKKSLTKLYNSFHSYKLAYQELKEETGLIYAHLNSSHHLKKTITIVDKLGSHYRIPLDTVSFLLQRKAELVYPALDSYKKHQDHSSAKRAIESLVTLFISSARKGIVNYGAIMSKNYGFLDGRAIHIDLSEFARNENVKEARAFNAHVLEMTAGLKKRLQSFYPEFLPFYEEALKEKLLLTEN